jgi:hypothetical protein
LASCLIELALLVGGRRSVQQAQDGEALRYLGITYASFSFARKSAEIAAEAATGGVCVVRTSLPVDVARARPTAAQSARCCNHSSRLWDHILCTRRRRMAPRWA